MKVTNKAENRIVDFHENLILKQDGSVYAIFEVPMSPVSLTDEAGKEGVKTELVQTLEDLVVYKHVQLMVLPMTLELEENFQKLSLDLADDTWDLAEYMLSGTYAKLQTEFGEVYHYKNFMVVPLRDNYISSDLRDVAKRTSEKVRKEILARFNTEVEFSKDWFLDFEEISDKVEQSLSLLSVTRLTTQQSIFINRLQWLRGLAYDKQQEIELVEGNASNVDEMMVKYLPSGIIRFENEFGRSYVKYLPVSTLPRNAWRFHLVNAVLTSKFPVTVLTSFYFNHRKGALSLRARSRRANSRMGKVIEEADEKGSQQKGSVWLDKEATGDLEDRADAGEEFLSYLMTLVITGGSPEEIREKEAILVRLLKPLQTKLSHAVADQRYLLNKMLITNDLEVMNKNWVQPSSLEGFAENLFFVTEKVGTDVGFYLGRVDSTTTSYSGNFKRALKASNNLVFEHPLLQNKLDVKGKITSNPAIAVVGETGGGKSYLAKLLFTYLSLLKSKILYIDPKAEMRKQYQTILKEYRNQGIYPEIQDYIEKIHFVTLDHREESNWGALDPIVYLGEKESKDLLCSMLERISPKNYENIDFQIELQEAISKFSQKRMTGEKVGSLSILRYLKDSETEMVSKIATLYLEMTKDSILSLAFSDGQQSTLSMEERVTVLEISGLEIPERIDDHMSTQQRNSMALMESLGYFCQWFGKKDPGEETVTFIDEARLFLHTEIGQRLLVEMKRIGRSMNNFLVFITQSIKDIEDSEDQTSFGSVYAFKEPNEVEDVLKYLKIPLTKESREMYLNMTLGQCLHKDMFGRVARITIDGVFPEITKLFDTVKTRLKSVA